MGSFNINTDKITLEIEGELRKEFIARMKSTAMNAIEKHFEDRRVHTGVNEFTHIRGPGTIEIDDFIIKKYIDEAGMKAYMERFFNENYQRIMDECMTKAIAHHCNRLAFAKVQEMGDTLKKIMFNPAEGSPETAIQMAAVINLRDQQKY